MAPAALAWDVGATVSVDCSSKGNVVLSGSFTNKETDASGDMNVTMNWNSKSDGPTMVNHQATKSFTIDTGASSVPAGEVVFKETWVNHSGSDQVTKAFSAKSCSQPESKKVFVCKYVGTPGVDERLQTGNNPISVSWKQGDRVPGTWFNDKHDRSYVLAWDTGQPEPDVSLCPAPEGPPPTVKITVPTVPVVDECGPGNAHYGDVPSGNYTVVRNEDGSITLTAKDGYVFPHGKKSVTLPKPEEKNTAACPVIAPKASISTECVKPNITLVNATVDNRGSNVDVDYEFAVTIDGVTTFYTIPVEAGMIHIPQLPFSPEDGKKVSIVINALDVTQATVSFDTATCVGTVTPPPTTKVTAVNGHFGDKCGPAYNLTFTPAVTKGVTYVQVRKGNELTVHAVAQKGYMLDNPLLTQSRTDQLVACPLTVVHKPPTTTKPPVAHQPPAANPPSRGIGANTGLDDATQPSGTSGQRGIWLAMFLMGLLVLEVTRRRTRPATSVNGRRRKG
jgi:hypothetical protein